MQPIKLDLRVKLTHWLLEIMVGWQSARLWRQHLTLVEAALQVLTTANPVKKARFGDAAARHWLDGAISLACDASVHLAVLDRLSRLSNVKLPPPQLMPKLGKAGSLQSRQSILHSLVHIEGWAIDLSWDIIARFSQQEEMPMEFFIDFVRMAQDGGKHFTLLAARLQELGSYYRAYPAHDGLWDSAITTSKSLLARLAVEHCIHEGRGLDVLPITISRFCNGGDDCTAGLLEAVVQTSHSRRILQEQERRPSNPRQVKKIAH